MSLTTILCSLVLLQVILSFTQAGFLPDVLTGADSITCPDKNSCPDGNTCCLLVTGSYGCCPHANAVCCSDKLHCCPEGTTCNLVQQTCDSTNAAMQWIKSVALLRDSDHAQVEVNHAQVEVDHAQAEISHAQLEENQGYSVAKSSVLSEVTSNGDRTVCPDPSVSCPDYNTCCLMPNHQWVCCPLYRAVCCRDGFHCCAAGSRCDPSSFRCYREDSSAELLALILVHHGAAKKQ